jgi:hypothetical protein
MSETERTATKKRAKRWTPRHAREVIARWRTSGKSASVYGAEHGITPTRLSYWAKQVGALDAPVDVAPAFVAVSVPPPTAAATPRAAIEIEVAGLTVRIAERIDALYVAQLIAALRTSGDPRC